MKLRVDTYEQYFMVNYVHQNMFILVLYTVACIICLVNSIT